MTLVVTKNQTPNPWKHWCNNHGWYSGVFCGACHKKSRRTQTTKGSIRLTQ